MRTLFVWTVALVFAAWMPLRAQEVPVAPAPAPPANHQLLVSTEWLGQRLGEDRVVVLHVGGDEEAYRAGHVPGARFLALDAIVEERHGLPNELPAVPELRRAFEAVGVSDEAHVVLYGERDGLAAARAFFTLDYLGHRNVSLLDGGLEAWRAEQRPLATGAGSISPAEFTPRPRPDRLVTADWVHQRLRDPEVVLIDARPPPEYAGERPGAAIERPGHIPGAHNLFWRDALVSDDDLRLREEAELRTMFARAGAAPSRTVVAYCRTGVQSSLTYFIARYLGYDVVMYDGSYLDWNRRTELPVAR
jgi:thiosulfate/3-mercaptopyruvate sulfurtransferase